MSKVNPLIAEYQKEVRKEKMELLNLELPRLKMIEFLREFQQPIKQRRIAGKTLVELLEHFEQGKTTLEEIYPLVEEIKLSIDRWCQLRVEAEKMPLEKRKKWTKAFETASKLRSDIIVELVDFIPRVRVSMIGHDNRNAEDLDGVGFIGMIKALENFDPNRGVMFETYARSWIYNSMIQYLRRDKLVNPSEKIIRSFRLYEKTISELQAKLNREPDEAEIAEAMGLSEDELQTLLDIDTSTTSLDIVVGEDEDTTLHEILGEEQAAPYQQMEATALARSLQQCMSKLNDNESSIVLLRWFPIKSSELMGTSMTIDEAISKMQEISLHRFLNESPEGADFAKTLKKPIETSNVFTPVNTKPAA